jgi:glycosyltransferase involved in cell wall biosynthesis
MEYAADAARPSARPRISCLMPVYNTERFLRQAIDSILNQTLLDFEFIIVNDGSTDRTPEILAEYARKDSRISVIHQPNSGIVSALNVGLLRCQAAYIARMDGDDICMPHRFAFQADHLDRNPECIAVGGILMGMDESGNFQKPYRFDRNKVTSFDVFPARVALTVHPLAMFRRDVLLKVNGYRATFPHAEDYDLFLRIARYGSIDNPDEILLCYRYHGQSVSRRNIELQEMAMAYAEFAAIEMHRVKSDPIQSDMNFDQARAAINQLFPERLIETYIDFRVWRRLRTVDPVAARRIKWRILCAALSFHPQMFLSRDYWLLRQRILGRFILNGLTMLRSPF